ncbi:MAG TPA: DUF2061 domain-containing protein [Permianibacter sp.]|nr:DUF2061 domain-containing protein [Permianibacter sp.]
MAKTASFAAVHFTVAFSIGYLVTGSVVAGGTLALVEPLCNTVAYYFHEKIWARHQANQQQTLPSVMPASAHGCVPG